MGRPGIPPPPPPQNFGKKISYHPPTYVPLYTLWFQQYDASCQKPRQNASKNAYFSKFSWGGLGRATHATSSPPPPQHKSLYETLLVFVQMDFPEDHIASNVSFLISSVAAHTGSPSNSESVVVECAYSVSISFVAVVVVLLLLLLLYLFLQDR